jgi:hypothetical protein
MTKWKRADFDVVDLRKEKEPAVAQLEIDFRQKRWPRHVTIPKLRSGKTRLFINEWYTAEKIGRCYRNLCFESSITC